MKVQSAARPAESIEARYSPRLFSACLFAVFFAISMTHGAIAHAQSSAAKPKTCTRVVLTGEVEANQQWQALMGEGWVFRLVPIRPASGIDGQSYSGWDLTVDRVQEPESGYPDALLLGTPPYGSLNEREIGTTFGLRAQDAIAWEPRHFHFFTSMNDLRRGRDLYRQLMPLKTGTKSPDQPESVSRNTTELLSLISNPAHVGAGTFAILDAKFIAGIADPPPYAQQWATHLTRVPHTTLQSAGPSSPLGEIRWIRFTATLWLPSHWQLPATPQAGFHSDSATCAQ